ncbi:MAG: helix-turn-helix domain-containing protein, partial [Caldilineaceae bacterium]|nr:helix-turn-helix domain-containing protein [Caldilineaceae bacterium]
MNQFTSIGQWIRQQRKLLDLTQAQLAQQVGCAVVTIKKIEQETRRPSPEMAELLANQLGVPQAERAQFLRLARGEAAAAHTLADPMPLPTFLTSTHDSDSHDSGSHDSDSHNSDGRLSNASTTFVARRAERQWLHDRLAQSIATRQPQIVFVAGEAGRGKSALLTAFAG